jgi:hypothetical protein
MSINMDVKPLKEKAEEIGGVLAAVLNSERDEMSRDEFSAKARTWLAVLKEISKNGRRK